MAPRFTRRRFIQATAIVTASSALNIGCPSPSDESEGATVIYRRSGRGRRTSNAANRYNANTRFKTAEVAQNNPAHPGDNSKVVMITVNADVYNRLFPGNSFIGDMREI